MYFAKDSRYEKMPYRRCGKSGLRLPAISLGLWQNFGFQDSFDNIETMCRTAFDLGITHFDLANNYGNPYNGSAEENFSRVMDRGLRAYRDELCISTKAGYEMWPGPYGARCGSRKYLLSSLDQSLRRMKMDYVDIYYHHVYDPNTPLEETACALDQAVRQGKALYVGVSNYNRLQTEAVLKIFRELKTPFVINQPSYSMLNRWIETDGLADFAVEQGLGLAVFSPLHQGLLTDRYLQGVPADSRAAKGRTGVGKQLDKNMVEKLNALNNIAAGRGQTLSQMALAWNLRDGKVTTVLVGASRPGQIEDDVKALENSMFAEEELAEIERILADGSEK